MSSKLRLPYSLHSQSYWSTCPAWRPLRPTPGWSSTSYPRFRTMPCRGAHNSTEGDVARQRLMQQIQNNPSLLQGGSAAKVSNWKLNTALLVLTLVLGTGTYASVQIYNVSQQKDGHSASRRVFLPVWVGFNWPTQRHFPFPGHLAYIGCEDLQQMGNDDCWVSRRQDDHLQRQVLDQLFRSPIVRSKIRLPVSVTVHSDDTLDVWLEPRFPTLHGPQLEIYKHDGKLRFRMGWRIVSVRWPDDIADMFSGMSSEITSMASADASRKTHENSSGRVHQARASPDSAESDPAPGRERDYTIAFSGTLHVSDAKSLQDGLVSYSGFVDETHLGLNRGIRITSVTLTTAEDGVVTAYKIK